MYDLSDSDRHPILQAEALREKDKEIARLRQEVATLGGPTAKSNGSGCHKDLRKRRKPASEIKAIRRQSGQSLDFAFESTPCHGLGYNELPISTVSNDVSVSP